MKRLTYLTITITLFTASLSTANAARKSKRRNKLGKSDYRAKEMLERGLEALRMKQEERGVKLISSIPRMFPKSQIRFQAHAALGEYYKKKRNFELATKQFAQLKKSSHDVQQAEGLYQTGICYYNMNNFDKAFMCLRKVTIDYPWTVYANEAFYYIGLCHFKLGRWSKAVKALEMVGSSVPTNVKGIALAEAGQRFYAKVADKDLVVLEHLGGNVSVQVSARSGDSETIPLKMLGRSGECYLGSIPTEPGRPIIDDGKLQVSGGDIVRVMYIDQNTETGERNQNVISTVQMISTATGGFTDGAYQEYTKGVFGNSDCFIRIKDLDGNTSSECDTITCKVYSQYRVKREQDITKNGIDLDQEEEETKVRDSITLTLTETAPHSGIFVGATTPRLLEEGASPNLEDNIINAREGDTIVLEYVDNAHINGLTPQTLTMSARLLLGDIQDVKIEHREVQSPELRAKKQLIEAKIYLRLAEIFKEVGLDANAGERADEGLVRVEQVIRDGLKTNMDRRLIEEAFSIKWDLFLAKDMLSEAIAVCRTLTKAFPESTLVDKALLKIGIAKMNSGRPKDVSEAVTILNSVTNLPKSEHKAEAAFLVAQIHEKQAYEAAKKTPTGKIDLSRAMLSYKRVTANYPDSPFAANALDKIIAYYLKKRDYRQAIEQIERVIQDYPDAKFLDKMLLRWGYALYGLGKLRQAIAKLDQLLSEWPNSPLAGKAKEMRDKVASRLGN